MFDAERGEDGDGGDDGCKISSLNCLICDKGFKDASPSRPHTLHHPLTPLLEDAIKTPLQDQIEFVRLCSRCFGLLEDLDDFKQRCVAIETSLSTLYSKTVLRRLGLDECGVPGDGVPKPTTTKPNEDPTTKSTKRKREESNPDRVPDPSRLEDQRGLGDDPVFDPDFDSAFVDHWEGVRRTRGRGRRRARGRARGRPRGRRPGRPPKTPREERGADLFTGDSLGVKLGELVTEILGEETEEIVKEEIVVEGRDEEMEEAEMKITVHPKPSIRCPYCPFEAKNSQSLLAHKSTHNSLDCPYCDKLLLTWWSYERHIKRFHQRENEVGERNIGERERRARKKQECGQCGGVFKSRPALTYHIATKHGSTLHRCGHCPAVFPHRSLLASHILRHGQRNVMCERCGRKFFTRKQLSCHENLFHRRARSYECEKCGARFSTLRVLRHHVRTQGDHGYYCQECAVGFKVWPEYLSHLLTHGLKCTSCNTSFTSTTAAHDHYQNAHNSQHELEKGVLNQRDETGPLNRISDDVATLNARIANRAINTGPLNATSDHGIGTSNDLNWADEGRSVIIVQENYASSPSKACSRSEESIDGSDRNWDHQDRSVVIVVSRGNDGEGSNGGDG